MKIFSVYINNKNRILQTIIIFFILTILSYFLVFSRSNYEITFNIVNIFITTIVPSLFPFILFSNILIYSNYFMLIANTSINRIIKRFFNISTYSASAVLFGFLFGYPNGARYVHELYEDRKITFKEVEYLLTFINNSSPAFILSTIGIGMFQNIRIGVLLLISHILASILIGKIFRYKHLRKEKINDINIANFKYDLSFETITKAITKSIWTMCIIFGFMVIFILTHNYIFKILELIFKPNDYIYTFTLGIMELTSGLSKIMLLPINFKSLIILISFILGFSSLSINFQIFSCVYENSFKLKNIIVSKFLHGILSSVITYILISIPQIYEYINISKEVNNTLYEFNYKNILDNHLFITLVIFLLHILTFLLLATKKKRLKSFL